jgi:hypothetical protein
MQVYASLKAINLNSCFQYRLTYHIISYYQTTSPRQHRQLFMTPEESLDPSSPKIWSARKRSARQSHLSGIGSSSAGPWMLPILAVFFSEIQEVNG